MDPRARPLGRPPRAPARWRPLASSLALLGLLASPRASAGPEDGYVLSNDAALRGGAAVVGGEDPASVWYNPAAAAVVRRTRIDASLSAYALRLTRAPGAMAAVIGDRRIERLGTGNLFAVVPAAFSFGTYFRRPNLSLVVTVHTPIYSDIETRMQITDRVDSGDYTITQELDGLILRRRYHAGLTLGWRPHERFSLGFQAGAIYDQNLENKRSIVSARGLPLVIDSVTAEGQPLRSPASTVIYGDQLSAVRVIAAEVAFGVRGQLTPWLFAGASVRAPGLALWRKTVGAETVGATVTDVDGLAESSTETLRLDQRDVPRWLTPWTISVGLAARFPRAWVEINASGSTAQTRGETLWQRAPVWNVQLGGSFRISERLDLGGGVFTDRTDMPEPRLYPSVKIHRLGASLAARFRNPLELDREQRRELVFETTVSLRYSGGVGRTGVFEVDYPETTPIGVTIDLEQVTRATEHLIGLYVGGGLQF